MYRIGIVSGYFNPLHRGHLEYINAAKKQCDFLNCIVNNDLQVEIKGSKKFMDENHRYDIMKNIKSIDEVYVSIDQDSSVANTIAKIVEETIFEYNKNYKFMFFNSGDRPSGNYNSQEKTVCDKLDVQTAFIPLSKVYSSSSLLATLDHVS
jgi:cytidyltransferase-like protein